MKPGFAASTFRKVVDRSNQVKYLHVIDLRKNIGEKLKVLRLKKDEINYSER